MNRFAQVTTEPIPNESKPILEKLESKYGFVPNLIKGLARSPQALTSYTMLSEAFESSALTPEEQQIVLLTASRVNECQYCTSVHSMTAEQTDLEWDTIERIRNRESLETPRYEALRSLTERATVEKGFLPHDSWTEFLSVGYTVQQALDVIVGVSLKTLTNSTNHMLETPLDEAFEKRRWTPEPTAQPTA